MADVIEMFPQNSGNAIDEPAAKPKRKAKPIIEPALAEPVKELSEEEKAIELIKKQEEKAVNAVKELRKLRRQLQNTINPPIKIPSAGEIQKGMNHKLAENILKILKTLNISATPKHCPNRLTSNGSREITNLVYFPNNASETPEIAKTIEDIPEDNILFAEKTKGYTTVKLVFEADGPQTIIGHSFCSGDDDYNGNAGFLIALKNAFDQIIARKINHPVVDLIEMIDLIQNMIALQFMTATK